MFYPYILLNMVVYSRLWLQILFTIIECYMVEDSISESIRDLKVVYNCVNIIIMSIQS